MITLYFETCYVASMVSPGGVVVITPDKRHGDVGGAFNHFFSEEYVEREKRKKIPNTYIYVPFHCHICVSPLTQNVTSTRNVTTFDAKCNNFLTRNITTF